MLQKLNFVPPVVVIVVVLVDVLYLVIVIVKSFIVNRQHPSGRALPSLPNSRIHRLPEPESFPGCLVIIYSAAAEPRRAPIPSFRVVVVYFADGGGGGRNRGNTESNEFVPGAFGWISLE